MVLLHGFTDTWRCWELVLPMLERRYDVLAPTLAGHAGGPEIEGPVTDAAIADAVERAMDEAGFETAHLVGNSLGDYVALQLAARDRARTVVALAPAGGWAEGDDSAAKAHAHFRTMQELLIQAAPRAEAIVSTPEGRRRASLHTATNFEHIPAELLAHQIRGAGSGHLGDRGQAARLAGGRRALPRGVDSERRLGRARRDRPLPAARRPA